MAEGISIGTPLLPLACEAIGVAVAMTPVCLVSLGIGAGAYTCYKTLTYEDQEEAEDQ